MFQFIKYVTPVIMLHRVIMAY